MIGEVYMKILFVGNSHTYNHEVPGLIIKLAKKDGIDCHAAMNAHGGWTLFQHTREPDVPFNIKYGGYDYVVLQEHAHPFDHDGKMSEAVSTLTEWAKQGGATPVIFMTWAQKHERHKQKEMTEGCIEAAKISGGLLAPVGERWWGFYDANPEKELYSPDNGHASIVGAELAAQVLWETIFEDYKRK